jgi:hypothetical protein
VGDDIRGIEITDPAFGRVIVEWDMFVSLDLHPRTERAAGKAASGADGTLEGRVVTRDGRSVTGRVRWDNDEEHGWEVLDAQVDGVDVSIEMGRIRSLLREGDSATVTLRDGRTFVLEGTEDLGDLGEANRGIFVMPEAGETVLVRWRELQSATFEP